MEYKGSRSALTDGVRYYGGLVEFGDADDLLTYLNALEADLAQARDRIKTLEAELAHLMEVH